MTKKVSESEFYMWRTLFAMSHVDNVVANEEIRFMSEVLEDVPFSDEQRKILTGDIKVAQDITLMFSKVSDPKDQARFFKFAHDLVWADGEYGKTEQEILLKLQKTHLESTDVDELVGSINLEFEDGSQQAPSRGKSPDRTKNLFVSFRDQFFNKK